MALRLVFRDKQIGRRFRVAMNNQAARIRRAELLAARDALDEMLRLGRENIASAGRFGRRWTEGLRGRAYRDGRDVVIDVTHDVPYFPVHQEGRVIHGQPLLAIPLSFASDAQGVRARDFPEPLFRVDRRGGKAPLLMSATDKQPKYVLKESVRIPKRFRVVEIIRETASRIGEFFRRRIAE